MKRSLLLNSNSSLRPSLLTILINSSLGSLLLAYNYQLARLAINKLSTWHIFPPYAFLQISMLFQTKIFKYFRRNRHRRYKLSTSLFDIPVKLNQNNVHSCILRLKLHRNVHTLRVPRHLLIIINFTALELEMSNSCRILHKIDTMKNNVQSKKEYFLSYFVQNVLQK